MTRLIRFTSVLLAGLTLSFLVSCQLITGAVGSDDNNLISLTIKDDKNNPVSLSPGFNPSTRDYSAAVANSVKTVSVSPMASDGKARVQVIGGDANLIDGANLIQVVVTAENGKKATYSITLTRAAAIAVTGVTLNVDTMTVTVGDPSVALTATVAPATATNASVTWNVVNTGGSSATLSAASGASVSLNLGASAGTATVTVTTADGSQTDTAVITIQAATIPVSGVTLNFDTKTVTVGDPAVALTATVAPGNASNSTVTWSVVNSGGANATLSATSGASVSLNLGSSAGTATVTVTTADGSRTDVAVITIQTAATTGTIIFTNDTGADIDFLYVALTNASEWGENYLSTTTLRDGDTFTVDNLPPGVYDVQAADSSATVIWDTYSDQAEGFEETITVVAGATIDYFISD